MNSKNSAFVEKAFQSVDATPSFNVKKVVQIDSKFARVFGTIRAGATPAQLLQAVANRGDRLAAVAGSFTTLHENGIHRTVEGIVTLHRERVVMNDSNREHFKAVSSSLYLDAEEKLWNIQRTAAGDILIRAQASDEEEILTNMLKSIASSVGNDADSRQLVRQVSECDASRMEIQGGDLVAFVGNNNMVEMGFVIAAVANADNSDAGLSVVTRAMEDSILIDRNKVVTFVAGDQLDMPEDEAVKAIASGGRINMDMIADYYRQVFQRDPEYYEKFMERFRSHVFA